MEDDDEFGDLYTDVLQPFTTSSSSAAPQPHKPSPTPQPIHRPIDLNIQSDRHEIPSAPDSNQKEHSSSVAAAPPPPSRVFDDAEKSPNRTSNDDVKDVNFDIEEEAAEAATSTGIDDDLTTEPIIPGLSNPEGKDDVSGGGGGGGGGGGDDWESDSEDDLQIVLNDNNHGAMAMMERGGGGGGVMDGGDDDDDDDDDEDGDPLVIVTDGDPNQGMGEEQEWGEDAGQAADGERKEGGEAMGKANGGASGGGGGGGIVIAPKIGYSNHGYHPFHSQFKVSVVVVVI